MKKATTILVSILVMVVFSISQANAWGDKKEKIKFNSKDLDYFTEVLDGLDDNDKDLEVWGFLTIPKKTKGKIPAMIYMHGSGGLSKTAKERISPWLKMFNKMGIATFQLDSFRPRKVSSTVDKQHLVMAAEMVVDCYKALEYLSNHPRIDKDRIGIMGESKGGGVTINTLWNPIRKAIGNLKFALHVALYPPCADYEKYDFTGAPILLLVGEKDDWTPPEPCMDFADKLKENGYDAKIVVYPGAYHAFDASYDAHQYTGARSFCNCRFLFKEDGDIIETTSGLSVETNKKEALKACQSKEYGVGLGKNWKAKKASREETKRFVTAVFNLNQ